MSVAPSAAPVAGSTKAKAKYYKMNGRKMEMISKKLYKDLAKVYFAEHLKQPIRDIFIIKEDVMKMLNDNSKMGEQVITKVDMATHLAKMTSAVPDKEASQISELVDIATPVKTFIFAAGRGHLHNSGVITKSQCSSQLTEPIASEDFGNPTLQAVMLSIMTAWALSLHISGLGLNDIPVNISLSSTVYTVELEPDEVAASKKGHNQHTAKALVFLDNIKSQTQQCFHLLQRSDNGLNSSNTNILKRVPMTTESAEAKFHLTGMTVPYTVCSCHCTYPPTYAPGSTTSTYPEWCTHCPTLTTECGEALLDYLSGLLSRRDIEATMDQACDDLMDSINSPQPSFIKTPFEAQYLHQFDGPQPGSLFVDRGEEVCYVFALHVDLSIRKV
ncbi:hypothetical protein EDD22DRAFT_959239 [Suillus occidentalis]|nr:hypothetical protein EDD22DRAFT_959239 [Suillus occidentalis]